MGAVRQWRADGEAPEARVGMDPGAEGAAAVEAQRPRGGRARAKALRKNALSPLALDGVDGEQAPTWDGQAPLALDAVDGAPAPTWDGEEAAPVEGSAIEPVTGIEAPPAEADSVAQAPGEAEVSPPEPPVQPPPASREPRIGGLPTRPFRNRLWQIQTELTEIHRERRSRRFVRALQHAMERLRKRTRVAGAIALAAVLALIVLLIVR